MRAQSEMGRITGRNSLGIGNQEYSLGHVQFEKSVAHAGRSSHRQWESDALEKGVG